MVLLENRSPMFDFPRRRLDTWSEHKALFINQGDRHTSYKASDEL